MGHPLRTLAALLVVGVLVHVDDGDPLGQLDRLGAALAPALAVALIQRQQLLGRDDGDGRPAASTFEGHSPASGSSITLRPSACAWSKCGSSCFPVRKPQWQG